MKRPKTSSILNLIVILSMLLATIPVSTLAEATATKTTSAPAAARPPEPESKEDFKDTTQVWETLPPQIKTKIDPRILAELRGEVIPAHLGGDPAQATIAPPAQKPLEQTRFLVYLKDQANLKTIAQQRFASRLAQRTAVFNALVNTAQTTQGPVKTLLEARMTGGSVASYQPFYIFNGLAVEGDLDTIVALAQRADVERIVANYPKVYYGQHAAPLGDLDGLHADNWNIDLVDAERVWDEFGITGAGAVVAVYDSGADWDHVALINQYRGWDGFSAEHNYDWFETDTALYSGGDLGPSATNQPTVYGAHGTHVLGTMVGDGGTEDTQVGMAPGAQWIGISDQLDGDFGDDISTHKAFQWLLSPTDLTGQLATANPALAPDVVNCSWGIASPADDFLEPDIAALRAAGIAVVFASGNPSAGDGSIGSPGSAPSAITVGATDIDDNVASFSGRGPSFWEGVEKPDLTAPGVDIKSTTPGDNYESGWSGTSMAAPHVSGLVALMISADLQDGVRDFNVDELESFMEYTALDLGDPGFDNDYGHGRIDAYSAVGWVRSAGDLRGTVSDASDGALIPEAIITGVRLGNTFSTQTDASGQYSTTVPAGAYDITVQAWGYQDGAFGGQTVVTGALSLANFALTPLPTAQLTGQVLDGPTPVSGALVYVADAPGVSYLTGASGDYTLTLPLGTHGLVVEASGYRILSEDVSVASGGSSHDFSLTPAPTILLVEADRTSGWFFGNPVKNYIAWALDYENYLYDEWEIVDAFGAWPGFGLPGVPPTTTLRSYDLVIWAHGGGDANNVWTGIGGSPAEIGADDELMDYLDAGGSLLLSGQDIAFWDDGTGWFDNYVRADLLNHAAAAEGGTASGVGFLDGLNLELTDASLKNYLNGVLPFYPDAVAPQDGSAYPALNYDNGSGSAILAVAPCDAPYRMVYVAAGLEAFAPRTGPIPEYAAMLDRSIEWLSETKPDYGVSLLALPGSQTDAPEHTVTYDLQAINTGAMTSAFELRLDGNAWPTRILSGTAQVTLTLDLPACSMQELALEVDIPSTANAGDQDTVAITALPYPSGAPVPVGNSAEATTIAFPLWQVQSDTGSGSNYWIAGAGIECTPYAIGGISPASQDLLAYESGQWVARAPKPIPFFGNGAEVIDGKIYVPGGYTDNLAADWAPSDVLEIYDPSTDTWSTGASMPRVSGGHSTAVANGKLYVFGGGPTTAFADIYWSVLEYDPASDAWSEKGNMPYLMVFGDATGLGDKVYVGGDYRGYSDFYEYDPAGDAWTLLASFPDGGRKDPILVSVDDTVYLYGGDSGGWGASYYSAFAYDPSSDAWSPISTLNGSHTAGAGAFAGGKLWAFGDGGAAWKTESLQLSDVFCTSDKSAWQSSVGPGERITYTIALHSDAADLTGAGVVDPIPAGTTWAGFGVNPIGATYNSGANQVEWSGSIPAKSDPLTFTFGADVDTTGWIIGDPITNVAIFDNGAGLVFSSTAVTVLEFADPSPSTKKVDVSQAVEGDVLNYAVRIENAVQVTTTFSMYDLIPDNTAYVPGSLTYTLGTASYDPMDEAIAWTGTLPGIVGYETMYEEWGDSDGNGTLPGVTYNWVDISGVPTATAVYLSDDDYDGPFPIGFTFSFYDNLYTEFYVNSNGFLSFGAGSTVFGNDCPLPSSDTPHDIIALMWDDLDPGDSNDPVYYVTYPTCPVGSGACLVVQYEDFCHYPGGATCDTAGTFEAILYEDGNVFIQFQDAGDELGSGSTTGLENSTGTDGITYACDTSVSLADNLAVLFGATIGDPIYDCYADVTFAVTTAVPLPLNTWITNTATITGPYGSIQRSAATLVNSADLSASTKSADRSQATVGDVVTYDLLLRNSGLLTATGASLSDPLPAGTTYVLGSLTCDDGLCDYASDVVTWSGDLAPGAPTNLSFAITLTTPMDDMTPVVNTATLDDGSGSLYELEATFNARSSDLSNSLKVADPTYVEAGGTVTFTIYIHNSGAIDVSGEMRDGLPPELTYVPGSLFCHSGTLGFGSCSYDSGVVTWTGTPPARAMVPVRFQATVPADADHGDIIVNSATITDHVWMTGYPATAEVMVIEPADLWLTKNGPGTVEAGGTLVYALTYGNDGPYDTLEPVQVMDMLPGDVSYVGSSPEGAFNGTLGMVTWDLGALEAGVTGTLILTTQVKADTAALTVLENAASIAALSQDINTANNSDQVLTVVGSNVNLLNSTKTADPPEVAPGQEVAYTISLINTGNLTASVTITDPIPDGAVYVLGSGELNAISAGLYDDTSDSIGWQGMMAPGDTATIRFRAQITATTGTRVTNTVTIDDGAGMSFSRQAQVLSAEITIYLPLVLKAYPPSP